MTSRLSTTHLLHITAGLFEFEKDEEQDDKYSASTTFDTAFSIFGL